MNVPRRRAAVHSHHQHCACCCTGCPWDEVLLSRCLRAPVSAASSGMLGSTAGRLQGKPIPPTPEATTLRAPGSRSGGRAVLRTEAAIIQKLVSPWCRRVGGSTRASCRHATGPACRGTGSRTPPSCRGTGSTPPPSCPCPRLPASASASAQTAPSMGLWTMGPLQPGTRQQRRSCCCLHAGTPALWVPCRPECRDPAGRCMPVKGAGCGKQWDLLDTIRSHTARYCSSTAKGPPLG